MKKYSQYNNLSPFELKDVLISMAKRNLDQRPMLNAGRGNPNFLALEARDAFFSLGQFALEESSRTFSDKELCIGGFPEEKGIVDRFEIFVKTHHDKKGVQLLKQMVSLARDQFNIHEEQFLLEITTGILGCNYPFPGRMLKFSEQLLKSYILKEMGCLESDGDKVDLFAVEGGTAAMTYLFNTLEKNYLLKSGDTVALGFPIFQPYIEMTTLTEYHFVQLNPVSSESEGWQWTEKELEKLLNPQVKIFCLVNPANPTAARVNEKTMSFLEKIVKERPDLMIITDDVYCQFVDHFDSLFHRFPYQTIMIYSFSKYFGATGWRLGVIAMYHQNVYDDLLKKIKNEEKKQLEQRYSSLLIPPQTIANYQFIDRLLAESRSVTLNHTAGLSLPQQIQMLLFAMFDYIDQSRGAEYRHSMKNIVLERIQALHQELHLPFKKDPDNSYYYYVLNIQNLAEKLYDQQFSQWLMKNYTDIDILCSFANEGGIVLLPGNSFGIERGLRISLANLSLQEYFDIGKKIREVLSLFFEEYQK